MDATMHEHHQPGLQHQYEDIEQQNDTYSIGMWAFLVQELMFFGGLFLMYTLYRWQYSHDFEECHSVLSIPLGGLNTANLLLSSFIMVLAVHHAQLRNRTGVLRCLGLVIFCGFVFMGIKAMEYSEKFQHNLYPGVNFNSLEHIPHANPNAAQLFFSLYFAMTGLHGIHVIVGILIMSGLAAFWYKNNPLVTEDFMPTEMCGLYWHFVDLVWIFLFPLFYLIPVQH